MKDFQTNERLNGFKYLPGFAQFILNERLDDYVREQIRLSYQYNIPILKYLKHFSEEQLFELSKKGSIELLTYLANNKANDQIRVSLKNWLNDELGIIGKFELVAEDITLINHIRQAGLEKFIRFYKTNIEDAFGLAAEIDEYILANNTAAINLYIKILYEELNRSREQLLEAQGIAHVGSFEWDFKTTSNENSPELRKIFETDKPQSYEELLEKVHPADREKVKEALANAIENGQYECEFRYLINNKQKVLWTRGIVVSSNDQESKLRGTVQDVTERKKIEENLLQKTIELERSNASLEEFAFVASHDLQEPLRKTLLLTEMLIASDRDNISEKGRGLINKIQDSTVRMKTLMEDILAFSSISSIQDKEEHNLQHLLDEVLETMEHTIKSKNAIVTSDNLPDACVIAFQFQQLFQNLISNSLKFSKEGVQPEINIRHRFISDGQLKNKNIEPAARYLELKFTDNGIGFTNEYSEKVFSLFQRLHKKTEYGGSGLGLAICRKVAENHKGIIYANAEAGKGAEFTVVIPAE